MLCIDKIRFWCKVEGFLDRINTPEMALRIVIDGTFAFPQLLGTTKQNITDWQEHEIPPIELSPYQTSYGIEFAVYREGELIGVGKTRFNFNEERKDCLDIVDKEFRVSGKLVYELAWAKGAKTGQFITYEQFTNAKVGSQGNGPILARQIKTEREKKYVKSDDQDDCSSGICACFAVRKKKKMKPPQQPEEPKVKKAQQTPPEVRPMDISSKKPGKIEAPITNKAQALGSNFKNIPYVYFEQQLQGGIPNDIQQLNRLCFYSRTIQLSK